MTSRLSRHRALTLFAGELQLKIVFLRVLEPIFTTFAIENGIFIENRITFKNCSNHTNEGQLASARERPLRIFAKYN